VVEQAAGARRRRRPGPGRGVEAAGWRRPGRGGDLPARVQEGAGARAGGRLRRAERRRREAGQGRHQVGAVQEGHPTPRQLRRPRRPRRVRREARHHAPHRSGAVVSGKRDYAAVTIVILAAAATGDTSSSSRLS
jgi:hypothetical protein